MFCFQLCCWSSVIPKNISSINLSFKQLWLCWVSFLIFLTHLIEIPIYSSILTHYLTAFGFVYIILEDLWLSSMDYGLDYVININNYNSLSTPILTWHLEKSRPEFDLLWPKWTTTICTYTWIFWFLKAIAWRISWNFLSVQEVERLYLKAVRVGCLNYSTKYHKCMICIYCICHTVSIFVYLLFQIISVTSF